MKAIFRNRQAVQALSGEVAVALDDLVTANNIQPLEVGEAKIRSGPGSPEGRIVGNPGDLYLRTDGGNGTAVTYFKETGKNTTTGWAAGSGGSGSGSGSGGGPPSLPGAHATTHRTGGTDPVDVRTLAGYPGDSAVFLNGMGTFSGAVTSLPPNIAYTDAANVFTQANMISTASPQLFFYETGAGTDLKRFRIIGSSSALWIQPLNDAGTIPYPAIRISHTGLLSVESGQIAFPSTANASVDPYTLDDYREVTFTPFYVGGTGQVYSTQAGIATKIGRQVCFQLRLTLTTLGTIPGQVTIGGLPFASNFSLALSTAQATYFVGLGVALTSVTAYINAGSTSLSVVGLGSAGGTATVGLTQGNLSNAADFIFTGQYMT